MLLFFVFSVPAGCASRTSQPEAPVIATAAKGADFSKIYRMGAGDKLRITVYGEDDLSGEYLVGSEGDVSLPLIGEVAAENNTLAEFQEAVAERLRAGYIKEPKVSVEVINYRPFYIHGEVKEAGEFPYQAGMSVLNAIAMAGGYTFRANTSKVYITHKGSNAELRYPAGQETIVLPGDVIRIPERFF